MPIKSDSPRDYHGRVLSEPFEGRLEKYISRKKDDESCWVWNGPKMTGGYGHLSIGKKYVIVHRYIYEKHKGPIAPKLTIDHLCRNRSCVNPDHLEAVTNAENLRRGNGWPGRNAKKTQCVHGHPFSPENTYIGKLGRACRTCIRYRKRAAYRLSQLLREAEPQEAAP